MVSRATYQRQDHSIHASATRTTAITAQYIPSVSSSASSVGRSGALASCSCFCFAAPYQLYAFTVDPFRWTAVSTLYVAYRGYKYAIHSVASDSVRESGMAVKAHRHVAACVGVEAFGQGALEPAGPLRTVER